MNVSGRVWPRNLSGQMALLIAIALFTAQAINFALLLNERHELRLEQVVGPATVRLIDAIQRRPPPPPAPPEAGIAGTPPNPPPPNAPMPPGSNDMQRHDGNRMLNLQHRIRRYDSNPLDPHLPRQTEIEQRLRLTLSEGGIQAGQIVTGLRPFAADDRWLQHQPPARADRFRRFGSELMIAVEQPGHGWLVLSVPLVRTDLPVIWRLIAQTLVLYGVVLIPVLWAGRQIARPLRGLASAARDFRPGESAPDLAEVGPSDVRAVVVAFNALRLRVGVMLDEKDRMLGAIGHDLKTPLAALRVRIESVEDEHDRNRMAETIDEMNRTLDDILSLARLGRPSEGVTDVDVGALVDAVVEDFRDLGADVTFTDAPRVALPMRPAFMRRAVRNLIENAVKYAGGAVVTVAEHDAIVRIGVTDRGPGIPPDRLNDVFDAFTRIEASRNRDTGGVGLGLALTRAIVREAGGEVTLDNRPEGGLLAMIELPRRLLVARTITAVH